jgi:hypothetical protein
MKRLLVLGLALGLANATAASALLFILYRVSGPDEVFGYFGSAPDGVAYDYYYYEFPWEYGAVPLALIVLNTALLPLVVRRARPGGG